MTKVTCPKCGMEAIGGSSFWGRSKPYCSVCGWNLQLAKDFERASMKQWFWSVLFIAAFFVLVGYLSDSGFAFFPFLFLSVFVVFGAIASWRRLKMLEASYPATALTNTPSSVTTAKESNREICFNRHDYLKTLTKPRGVRLKPIPRVITVAFPVSLIFIAYFGYQTARESIVVAGPLATLRDLSPLLLFALIWSGVGIATIRSVRRDRKLLVEGDFAMAVVTHQEISGGKNRSSKIRYEFRDAAGRRARGQGTDESWKLYEDMELPVFYDPQDPTRNVALCAATCELKIG